MSGSLAAGETGFPGAFVNLAALVIPEALEHVLVIQQRADAAGKFLPDQRIDALLLVQQAEFFQKGLEGLLLRETLPIVDLAGIGGVEGDPQEDEATVEVKVVRTSGSTRKRANARVAPANRRWSS